VKIHRATGASPQPPSPRPVPLLPPRPRAVFAEARQADKLAWFNPRFSLGPPFNIWMGVIGGTVMVMSSHGAEQLIVQRVLACKTVADGRKALALSAVVILPLFLIFNRPLRKESRLWL